MRQNDNQNIAFEKICKKQKPTTKELLKAAFQRIAILRLELSNLPALVSWVNPWLILWLSLAASHCHIQLGQGASGAHNSKASSFISFFFLTFRHGWVSSRQILYYVPNNDLIT